MPVRSNISVVASPFELGNNGGRKLVRLTNGWLICAVYDNSAFYIRFYKSIDNGATWTQLCTSGNFSAILGNFAIVSKGTLVFLLMCRSSNTISSSSFDALTVTNTTLPSTVVQSVTGYSGCSLAINETGTELHGVWGAITATYPTSYNTYYAKGTISADGSISWSPPDALSNYTTSGYGTKNPSVVVKGNTPYIIAEGIYNNNHYISVFSTAITGREIFTGGAGGWGAKTIYSGTTYNQFNPSAMFVPQNINGLANGRIWVAWNGKDSVDNAIFNIRVSYSDDNGLTWSAMQKITTGNTLNQWFPSFTANALNEIFLVWDGSPSAGVYEARYSKYLNEAWGSVINLTSSGSTSSRDLSILYSSDFGFVTPLFIREDSSKVSFYGNWVIVTSSAEVGSIGIKTDYSNLLTYALTTDGTMETITEKINGVVVGIKSLSNSQSTTVSLTSAQWDLIAFGKYKNSNAELNTLTIEMSGTIFIYTFNKQLSADDTFGNCLLATEDIATAFIPSIKSKIATGISSKGGIASATDSWDMIITAINNLSVRRFASGSTGTVYFASGDYTLSANLGFVPKLVIMRYTNTAGTVFNSFRLDFRALATSGLGGGTGQWHNDGTGGLSDRLDIKPFDGTTKLVVNSPFNSGNHIISWEAYE
jgi:hypothetical protein